MRISQWTHELAARVTRRRRVLKSTIQALQGTFWFLREISTALIYFFNGIMYGNEVILGFHLTGIQAYLGCKHDYSRFKTILLVDLA